MPTLNDVLAGSLAQAVQVQQIIDALKGTPNKGVPVALVSLNDPNNYALTVQNDDPTNSRALSVLKSDGTALITADANGVTLASPLHLPSGSITSAMIADGTIATADIAVGAVHGNLGTYSATPTFSTTTTSTWINTPVSVSATLLGGVPVLVTGFLCVRHSVAGADFYVALTWDGTTQTVQLASVGQANHFANVNFSNVLTEPSAGGHALIVQIMNLTAGTIDLNGGAAQLNIQELRR